MNALLLFTVFSQSVDDLEFSRTPVLLSDNYIVAACFCDVMEMQEWKRSGVDVPLSPQFMSRIAAREYEDVYFPHGWSNPILGWDLSSRFGSTPASIYKPIITDVMEAEALKYRVGQDFYTWYQVPDYPSAVEYIKVNDGSAAIITTGGRRAYAIIDVDINGLGIWVDHNGRKNQRPLVTHKAETEGVEIWNSMIYGQGELGPENFVVILTTR